MYSNSEKCKYKGKPDLMGPKSTATYPATAQKGGPKVEMGTVKDAYKMGTEETVPSKSGNMVDSTFSKISMDVSYSKTPTKTTGM